MDYDDAVCVSCNCTGIRYCKNCVNSDRVKSIQADAEKSGVDLAKAVFEKNKQHLPQSSCAFSALPAVSPFAFCHECGNLFAKPVEPSETAPSAGVYLQAELGCSAHRDWEARPDVTLKGLYSFPGLLTPEHELDVASFLDGRAKRHDIALESGEPVPFPGWKDSQSGRRKQDFGPAPNFKKRKVKVSDLPGMPIELKDLLQSIMHEVNRVTLLPKPQRDADAGDGFTDVQVASGAATDPFVIAQASCLDYDSEALSNLDPHVDDIWLWGPRVAGVSLLNGCLMTFVHADGWMADVHLPRRWGFVLSGDSRYKWLHGIRHTGIQGRRLSVTMRELEPTAGLDEDLQQAILTFAQTFV